MKKNISSNDCRTLFDDKFDTLSMKDIGIELKHFSVGTAPERPSFLVNQDDLTGLYYKQGIIEGSDKNADAPFYAFDTASKEDYEKKLFCTIKDIFDNW